MFGDVQTTDTLTDTLESRGGTITIQHPAYASQTDTTFGLTLQRPEAAVSLSQSTLTIGGYRGFGLTDMSVIVSRQLDTAQLALEARALDGSIRGTEVVALTDSRLTTGNSVRFESLGINLGFDRLGVGETGGGENQQFDFSVSGVQQSSRSGDLTESADAVWENAIDLRLGSLNSNTGGNREDFVRLGELVSSTDMFSGTLIDADWQEISSRLEGVAHAVSSAASSWGAIQNRLESDIRSIGDGGQQTQAMLSRISDTDYALETAQMAAIQIMQQASTAAMTQANQMPNIILELLKD
jgi:flagellin-like hook-associated protein FlgL